MARTVVIIDDDSDDLDIMRETLNQIDPTFICVSFVFPDEAIRVLKNKLIFLPDYIFVDINMPKLTGIECLAELRTIKDLSKTPIIVYSTSMRPEVSEQLLGNGADYTLEKPPGIKEYLTTVEAIVFNTGIHTKYLRSKNSGVARINS